MEKTRNFSEICGVIKEIHYNHEVFGTNFYKMTVDVNRLSENVDSIPVMITYEQLIDSNVKIGDRIKITGEFRSYNDEHHLILYLFAKDIIHVNSTESINKTKMTGIICKQPIYRKTPLTGREITDIIIAVDRTYYRSDYIPIILWGRNAKLAKNLEVGTQIAITGRIQSREFKKHLQDGNTIKKTAYEVSVGLLEV